MILVGNIYHPDVGYCQCVLGLKKSGSFLFVFTSEIMEVKQTACEKLRLILIAPITDNHW